MDYKIIFCDLDGTGLDEYATLSRENAEAIHALAARGITFVPTTGRAFGEIPLPVVEHPDIRYFITSNGTAIWDKQEGRFFDTNYISGKKLDDLRAIMADYTILPIIHKNGYSYYDGPAFDNYAYYGMTDYYHDCLAGCSGRLENFDKELANATEIAMFALFFKYREQMQAFAERLRALGGYYITASTDMALEITIDGSGKGEAIRRLLKRLNIPADAAIGMGDSKNDITMLEAVALPLAVENACTALKAHAKQIICSHTEHPIRYVLEHIV
jgi:Cof subfamily protein (haloacid dehalogenase superfamily)